MITIQHLTKRFGSVIALENFSLEVCSGEIVVIQAPSGSGKSTLLRLIAGLEVPDQGEIRIDGKLVSSPGWIVPPYTRDMGFVFQRAALWPHMTVAQNIRFGLNRRTKKDSTLLLRDLLRQMVLEKLINRYPSQLSGGEARRVALARALAAQPRFLLLDEPLTSLDPDLQQRLLSIILNYVHSTHTTLLYVTHVIEEARQVGGTLLRLGCR